MSDSVRPRKQQATRLLCPWDSPGRNTEVGCHFLLQCMHAWLVASVVSSFSNACMHAKLLQSCLTLCYPTDGSSPGSSIPGVLQARILEWVAIYLSNACMHAKLLQLCPTLCDPLDSSPPGSSAHGILLTRILEWVAISFSPKNNL